MIKISSFSVEIRRIECRYDKLIFSTNYGLSSLLDIVHTVTTGSFSVQIPGVYVRSSAVVTSSLSERPERAVWPGPHIAARGFERTIVSIAESRYGACHYGKREGHA